MQAIRKKAVYLFAFSDYIASWIAWTFFFVYRKKIEGESESLLSLFDDVNLIRGLLLISMGWLCLMWFSGSYESVYRKSYIRLIGQTFFVTLLGCLILLFSIVVDDIALNYITYLESFISLFLIHFTVFTFFRLGIIKLAKSQLNSNKIYFPSLFVSRDDDENVGLQDPPLYHRIVRRFHVKKSDIVKEKDLREIDDILIDLPNGEEIKAFINTLGWHADRYSLFVRERVTTEVVSTFRIKPEIYKNWIALETSVLPLWQKNVKRLMDILVSSVALFLLIPIILVIGIGVRLSSKGSIVFRQERIGRYGKSFRILKFRSMYGNAEQNGPELSFPGDRRVTSFGRILRKWRLDEIPQFWNVLIGQMSLVGPRPERKYFIDKIKKRVPNYTRIFSVRPGITSWGQVKYGYASDVSEIVQRSRFDLLYIENMSILLDLRILYRTLIVLFMGKGT